jgi:CBS domain-containing protein
VSAPGADGADVSLFRHRVRDLVTRPPVTCPPSLSALAVAQRFASESVGSVIVMDAAGTPAGIVTDQDLRARVVAEGRDAAATPVAAIMSAPLVTVSPGAFAFEAALAMTRHRIRHVAVVEDGRLLGVVSSRDLLGLHAAHPVALARDIERAGSAEALAGLGSHVTRLVRRLVDEGGSAHDIGQIVAELNDRVVVRVLDLTAAALAAGGQPVPAARFCWLGFGSEARREQTLRTDQDNGLVYEDPAPPAAAATAAFYARFAEAAIATLVAVGFPPCPGDAMASNPRWCQPLSVWAGYFRRWLDHPAPEEVLAACIHFDVRPIAGSADVAAPLEGIVRTEARAHPVFLGLLARDVVTRRVPRTLLGNIALPRRGPERGTVDVKSAGVIQLTGAARVHALELGLAPTNTVERFRAASERGLYTPAEAREITDAYQHLMRLRLVHQLERLEAGARPDNRVSPARLSRADRLLFRDALATVERVQAGLRARFSTDRLG